MVDACLMGWELRRASMLAKVRDIICKNFDFYFFCMTVFFDVSAFLSVWVVLQQRLTSMLILLTSYALL